MDAYVLAGLEGDLEHCAVRMHVHGFVLTGVHQLGGSQLAQAHRPELHMQVPAAAHELHTPTSSGQSS